MSLTINFSSTDYISRNDSFVIGFPGGSIVQIDNNKISTNPPIINQLYDSISGKVSFNLNVGNSLTINPDTDFSFSFLIYTAPSFAQPDLPITMSVQIATGLKMFGNTTIEITPKIYPATVTV
jgi:hypothetical protein